MKVKIRGLVFAGFAAAVFAQSASAGITPPSLQDPAHPDSLKKTVTSQDYVDENFQERLQGDASDMYLTESGGSVTEKAAFIGWNYGQGGENKEWVKLEGKNELDSSHAYVEIVHDTKTSDKKHYVKMGDDALANTAALITAAGEGTGGNSATTLEQGRLPTAKAVYDFVTGGDNPDAGFQRKVATTEAGEVMIGYRKVTGTGSEATYDDSTWYSMKEGQQHGPNSVPFVRISKDELNSEVFVDLHRDRIIGSDSISQGTGYYTSGIDGTNAGNRLATGIAVYNYAAPMNWQERAPSGYANKKLVTDSSGNVTLAEDTTANIPSDMPNECDTATGTHVCALVAYWDATLNNNAGGVKYEWTIMAPTGSTGGGSGSGSGSGTGGGNNG